MLVFVMKLMFAIDELKLQCLEIIYMDIGLENNTTTQFVRCKYNIMSEPKLLKQLKQMFSDTC